MGGFRKPNQKSERLLTLPNRGWTKELIDETINHPFTTRDAINKATGNKATAYYKKDGHYVIRDNVSEELVQISNRNIKASSWIPDDTIKNPYILQAN